MQRFSRNSSKRAAGHGIGFRIGCGILFGVLVPLAVSAVTLNKASFIPGEPILITSPFNSNAFVIYNVSGQKNLGGATLDHDQGDLAEGGWNFGIISETDEFSILEVTENGVCEDVPDTYEECKTRPEYVGEFLFRILRSAASIGHGVLAHRPEIEIQFPREGDFIRGTTTIRYAAADEDNKLYAPFGFSENPISLFYSEDNEHWILIARDERNTGEFAWNTSSLPEGAYWLQALARDQSGEKDETVSGPFEIDTISPLFDVAADPAISKGENVKLIINASEPLARSPDVWVRQKNYVDVQVYVQGEGSHWEGFYEVRPGADGTASVRVEGADRAGNSGASIRRGGYFQVGIAPPPTPIIISPRETESTLEPSITIEGTMREDTKALLFVNDEARAEIAPDSDGFFRFTDVLLSKTKNKGSNLIKVVSEDKAGNRSEPAVLVIKANAAPVILMREPKEGITLSRIETAVFDARDGNADRLRYRAELSSDAGVTWRDVAGTFEGNAFRWDTRQVPDGQYLLRITADDGMETASARSAFFRIENFLPLAVFNDTRERIITNKTSVDIRGKAVSPFPERSVTIAGVEASIDDGVTWSAARADDGAFDGPEEGFNVLFKNIQEGSYEILLRTKDSREYFGNTVKPLVVDFGPPTAPVVEAPLYGTIVADSEDSDAVTAGIQREVRGKGEPGSVVRVIDPAGRAAEGRVGADGVFITAATLTRHGSQTFFFELEDAAENRSSRTPFALVSNNPPDIKFLWPREGGGLNHKAVIEFEIQDRDRDTITKRTLSYKRKGAGVQTLLSSNIMKGAFAWDVSGVAAGEYELILSASDGVSERTVARPVYIDNTAPSIDPVPPPLTTFKNKFLFKATGSAGDDFSGIEHVEYSIDGEHWSRAVITRGYRTPRAEYRVSHPYELKDGTYPFSVRATDSAGNVSEPTPPVRIIVDTTPPRVGSYLLLFGALPLLPSGGVFDILSNTDLKIQISLEADTAEAALHVRSGDGADDSIPLEREGGRWKGVLHIGAAGRYDILLDARDEAGNTVEKKELGSIEARNAGRVFEDRGEGEAHPLEGAHITLFLYDEDAHAFRPWQAEQYDLPNPLLSDERGEYRLFLPAGRYYLTVRRGGYERLKTNDIIVPSSQFIASDFRLKAQSGFRKILSPFVEFFDGL